MKSFIRDFSVGGFRRFLPATVRIQTQITMMRNVLSLPNADDTLLESAFRGCLLFMKHRHARPKKQVRPAPGQQGKPEKALKTTEELLLGAAAEISGQRIVMTSSGAAQAAAEVARLNPSSNVECYFLDVFLADAARVRNAGVENLKILCEPDFAAGGADVVGLTLAAGAESDLSRDLIQQAHQQLGPEGRLFVATDNPHDHWVHEHLKEMFEKVTNRGDKHGRLYIGSKPIELKKLKDYSCWFAFRDGERLIEAMSRPGVFSHRKLDLGARALIESLTVPEGEFAGEAVRDGMRVLDIGSGSGVVSFATAFRAEGVHVHAMDANARAIQCTQLGAEKNGITTLTTQLEAAGRVPEPESYDLVLANPPYFSNFKIAEIFIKATQDALKVDGRTHFVTKQPEWFVDAFTKSFVDISVREIRGYYIVKGTQCSRMPDVSGEDRAPNKSKDRKTARKRR